MTLPQLPTGTWTIDPTHSDISFSVRHMMVSKVKGRFRDVAGTIDVNDGSADIHATVQVASLDTGNADRDAHLRAADFFDVEQYPTAEFYSTGLDSRGEDLLLRGELTLHGVTRPVELVVEFGGVGPHAMGGQVAGFTATTTLSRTEFGITFSMPLEGGGAVIGDAVRLTLEIEAVQQ